MGSSNCSSAPISRSRWRSASVPSPATSSKASMPGDGPPMRITVRRSGSLAARNSPGRQARQLRRQFVEHGDVVAALQRRGGDQRLAADLVQRIFQLGQAVGRVDVDEDEPGFRRRELGDHPLRIVRRPDADAVAGLQPERQQPGREGVDPLLQLAIGPAQILLPYDQCIAIGPALCGRVEVFAQCLADQRLLAAAMHIAAAQLAHDACLPSPADFLFPVRKPRCDGRWQAAASGGFSVPRCGWP